MRRPREGKADEIEANRLASGHGHVDFAGRLHRAGLPSGHDVRAAIRESLSKAGLENAAFLGDSLKVPEEWTASLDLYLGELENAVVLQAGVNALDLARALEDGQTRGSLLQPRRFPSDAAALADPAIQSSLGDALSLPEDVVHALPPAYLVESAGDARRLASSHPGIAFISRDRLWAQAGVLHVQGHELSPA